jgi:uncharacterized membrane protein
MHTGVAIAFLVLFMWLIARIVAHRHDAVDGPSVIVRGLGIGASIGAACAVVFLTTQVDLVPDEIENGLLPPALILGSLGLVIGTWYRVAWR